jgi:hypothetical protein
VVAPLDLVPALDDARVPLGDHPERLLLVDRDP